MLTLFAVLSVVLIFGPFVARVLDLCPAAACMPQAAAPALLGAGPRWPAWDWGMAGSQTSGAAAERPRIAQGRRTDDLPPGSGAADMIDVANVEGRLRESSVKKVSEILTNYPQESLTIIRAWLIQGR